MSQRRVQGWLQRGDALPATVSRVWRRARPRHLATSPGAERTCATRVNGAAGHTGFTGTSMWLDPKSKRFVVRPSLMTFGLAR